MTTTNVPPCVNCGSVETHPHDLFDYNTSDRHCGRCPLPCDRCGSTLAYPNDFYGCAEPKDDPGGAEWVRVCGACNGAADEGNVADFFGD